MHDEQESQLEARLVAAAGASRAVSSLPEAVAATVRRCGRVRREKFAAFSLAPIALAAGLVVMQLNKPADPDPVFDPPEDIAFDPFLGNGFPSLIGRREYALIFDDSPGPTVVQSSSERVYTVGDAYDAALIEALFNGS